VALYGACAKVKDTGMKDYIMSRILDTFIDLSWSQTPKIFLINWYYLNMRSLAEFSTYQEVFKNATNLPAFFDSNLVDAGRVVKAFYNDPQAHIRIFYYQYLRLCF